MALITLRPYQEDTKTEIRKLFSSGVMRVIMCKPTGSGKTVTFANMAREAVMNGFVVMIIVDRKELLDQAKKKLMDYGLNPSLITAGKTARSGANSYVSTVQTLTRRPLPNVGLLIIDEAHKQIFDKILLRPEYENTLVIGATATPKRTGKMRQLSDLYEELVETVTISDLISKGFLVPAITYGAKVDTSKIDIKRGDYDPEQLYKAFDKRTLYSGVVEKYKRFANGTKAICFNINVEHSKKVTAAFNAAGISAVHLDGNTPKKERERILDAFSRGLFSVLNNVGILIAGYDEWTIETIIVNLSTLSLSKWLQMGGRGSRITPKEFQGVAGKLQKSHFNLIDMGGNVFKLGFWEQERDYSLTHVRKDTIDAAPVKECLEDTIDQPTTSKPPQFGCGAIIHASAPKCKFCGYEFPKKKSEPKEAEFIQLENYQFLPTELVGRSWGTMSIEELEDVRRIKGYKQGWIIRQILLNKDLDLLEYAKMKGYKSPKAWVTRMEKMYIKK